MPLYDYHCDSCGEFTAWGKMSESDHPAACPECGAASPRMISAPRLAVMAASQRSAYERNEKSAHEPKMAKRSSCGCTGSHTCSSGKTADPKKEQSAPAKPAMERQTKANARPWMLGH